MMPPRSMTLAEAHEAMLRFAWPGHRDDPATALTLGALGIAGEAGEVTDLIKKWLYHDKPRDREALLREVGDVLFYAALVCHAVGATLDDAAAAELDKLARRFPSGVFTPAAAAAKLDEAQEAAGVADTPRVLSPGAAKARAFAVAAHGQQQYGPHPYIVHLDDVADRVRAAGGSDQAVQAAYLHDVLEDTPVTASDLGCKFRIEVASLVCAVTKKQGQLFAGYLDQIAAGGPDAILVKLADRLANGTCSRSGSSLASPGRWANYEVQAPTFRAALRPRSIAQPWGPDLWGQFDRLFLAIPGKGAP